MVKINLSIEEKKNAIMVECVITTQEDSTSKERDVALKIAGRLSNLTTDEDEDEDIVQELRKGMDARFKEPCDDSETVKKFNDTANKGFLGLKPMMAKLLIEKMGCNTCEHNSTCDGYKILKDDSKSTPNGEGQSENSEDEEPVEENAEELQGGEND
jgi:hypothetical protein